MKSPKQTRILANAALVVLTLISTPRLRSDQGSPVDLPSPLCNSLQAPEGNVLKFHAYATGVQIYKWNGTAWAFVAPNATLYADAGHHSVVGTHYTGPTWESNSGSNVVGRRIAACTPETTAIPWLLLKAVSSDGPGVFDGVTYVQRLSTVGGTAPIEPGTFTGQEADVPYTAEYYFYALAD
jgi:hypothetical protein